MKTKLLMLLFAVSLFSCEKSADIAPSFYECQFNFSDSSHRNPNKQTYQAVLDDMTQHGVVGAAMSVFTNNNGLWLGASGIADLHNRVTMKPCHITRMGSIVKMFTATIVLKLQEEGKLRVTDKISQYLQGDIIDNINQAETVSIKQLLNHSSGLYNYIQNLRFQTASLNDLLKKWQATDLLQYAYHKAPYFSPGADVRYSNTNYILLGLLIEKIEQKPLYQVFDEKIIQPLNLRHTQFAGKNNVPDGIVRGYVDMYSNLQVTESTYYSGWDYFTADGGLISNVYDLNVFFRALMNGQLIHSNSLNEMLSWLTPSTQDPDYYSIEYGMGIFKANTSKGICYMHSGDAIGYYASMLYFPEDSTTVVYAVNSNYGKIDALISTKAAMEKIVLATKQ